MVSPGWILRPRRFSTSPFTSTRPSLMAYFASTPSSTTPASFSAWPSLINSSLILISNFFSSYLRVFSPSDRSFLIFWRYLKSPKIQISPEGGNLNTPFQQFTHKTIFRTRSHSHAQSVKNGHAFLVYPFISILISAVRLYVPYGHLHILTAELNSVHSFKHVRLTRTLTFLKLLRTSLVPYSLYFPGLIWPDSG